MEQAGRGGTAGGRLGRWTLLSLLGQGGMGSVFLARDDSLGREVALKVLPAGASEARRRRFLREMVAAGSVRHPAVCAVHEAGEDRGHLFLVMDAIKGESLAQRLQRGPLAQEEAARLIEELARGVQALHQAGVLHRDIKPGNVLVDEQGRPLLVDFGVALLDDMERLTRTGQAVGTPVYMAPEQLAGDEIDARADVHALGSVLYEALTGFHAWGDAATPGDLISAKTSPPTPACERRAGIDRRLDAICRAALAPDPRDRPYSAGVLADALAAWREGRAIPAFGRRRRAPLLLLGLGLALLALFAWSLGAAPEAALSERLLAARLELERQSLRARSLAALDLAPERLASIERDLAAVGSTAPAAVLDDARRLRAWLLLQALARGDRDRAAEGLVAVGSRAGAPGDLLLGGLLAGEDPPRALRHLEQAERAGLAPLELHAWRVEALARRGTPDKDAAQVALGLLEKARAAGHESELAGSVETAALLALGRRSEAAAALARLAHPSAELRWELALGSTEEALGARGVVAALDALRSSDAARPPGPTRPGERRVVQALLAVLLPEVEAWSGRTRGPAPAEAELMSAGLLLHAALVPDPPPVRARVVVLELLEVGKMLPSEWAKDLAEAAWQAWRDDPEVLLGCAEQLRPTGHVEGKRLASLLSISAAAEGCTQGPRLLRARGFHAYALARSRRAAEARERGERLIAELEPLPGAQLGGEAGAALGDAYLACAIAAREAGENARAVELTGRALARDLPQANPGELQLERFYALISLGDQAELLREAAEYARVGPPAGGIKKTVATLAWDVLVRAERWPDALRLAEHLVRDGLRGAGSWPLRRALARARSGDPALAADELAQEGSRSGVPPELLGADALAALRRGEAAAILRIERAILSGE